MEMLYERCCGLDVHKRSVVACLLAPGPDGQPTKELRSFGTMTADLLALADWFAAADCTHVAMEATGVFWKPIYNLLEDGFAVLVVTRRTSRPFLAARRMCAMPSGSRTCCVMACCAPASSRIVPSVSYAS